MMKRSGSKSARSTEDSEPLAVDRQIRESYPTNNFAAGATALLGLVALIVVLYVTGVLHP